MTQSLGWEEAQSVLWCTGPSAGVCQHCLGARSDKQESTRRCKSSIRTGRPLPRWHQLVLQLQSWQNKHVAELLSCLGVSSEHRRPRKNVYFPFSSFRFHWSQASPVSEHRGRKKPSCCHGPGSPTGAFPADISADIEPPIPTNTRSPHN